MKFFTVPVFDSEASAKVTGRLSTTPELESDIGAARMHKDAETSLNRPDVVTHNQPVALSNGAHRENSPVVRSVIGGQP